MINNYLPERDLVWENSLAGQGSRYFNPRLIEPGMFWNGKAYRKGEMKSVTIRAWHVRYWLPSADAYVTECRQYTQPVTCNACEAIEYQVPSYVPPLQIAVP